MHTVAIVDNATNQPIYPLDVSKVLRLNIQQTLGGSTTYQKIIIDVTMYVWSNFLGSNCSWHFVPIPPIA
jgi:hypothetical protein